MKCRKTLSSTSIYVPGEVLALLSPLQELEPGLYLVSTLMDGWVVLRLLIDDEDNEQLLVTKQEATLPVALLDLFMPVGLRLSCGE